MNYFSDNFTSPLSNTILAKHFKQAPQIRASNQLAEANTSKKGCLEPAAILSHDLKTLLQC